MCLNGQDLVGSLTHSFLIDYDVINFVNVVKDLGILINTMS